MSELLSDKKHRPVSGIVSAVITIITVGYTLPWMIAALRGKSNHWTIFWLNVLLGWTVIGWIIAFIMAVSPHKAIGIR